MTTRGRKNERVSVSRESETSKVKRNFVGNRAKMDVSELVDEHDHLKNCHLRWVNDEKGAIHTYINNGWSIVEIEGAQKTTGSYFSSKNEGGSKMSQAVTMPVGRGHTTDSLDAVLMSKPIDDLLLDEVSEHQTRMTDIQEGLQRGTNQDGERAGTVETYAPKVGGNETGFKSIQQQLTK